MMTTLEIAFLGTLGDLFVAALLEFSVFEGFFVVGHADSQYQKLETLFNC